MLHAILGNPFEFGASKRPGRPYDLAKQGVFTGRNHRLFIYFLDLTTRIAADLTFARRCPLRALTPPACTFWRLPWKFFPLVSQNALSSMHPLAARSYSVLCLAGYNGQACRAATYDFPHCNKSGYIDRGCWCGNPAKSESVGGLSRGAAKHWTCDGWWRLFA